MAQLMPLPLTVSCFSKIQIGFTFLVPAHPGSPEQTAVKRVCVFVCVCVCFDTVGWMIENSSYIRRFFGGNLVQPGITPPSGAISTKLECLFV